MANNDKNINPSILLSPNGLFVNMLNDSIKEIAETIQQNGMSNLILSLFIVIGYIIDVIPNIPNILKILDPITLPTETSFKPSIVALKLTPNSGKLVPIPTIKAPTINSFILNLFAISTAPFTKRLAPNIINNNDIVKIIKFILIIYLI